MELSAIHSAPIIGHKSPKDTRVVVAMSGGVDSSVTAAVLKQQGYDVVGITLQLYDQGLALQRKGACCAGQDIYDARQVADKLGIPHYVLDYENVFQAQVMEDFADSYLRGETPIPCVKCNQKVKFKDLLQTARELGADALATGHYVRRIEGIHGPELHKGTDPARDQSYFLFATTPEQLSFLRFPLGHLPKTETRTIAQQLGLPVAEKPDSQDICFVPNGSYAKVVERLRPGALEAGDIIHVDGRVLGRHEGIINYTVGQRKGLGVGGRQGEEAEPLYVIRLDPIHHRVIVGPRTALARTDLHVKDVNWLGSSKDQIKNLPVQVRVRSSQPVVSAFLTLEADQQARVVFEEPQYGVSPGQACVFYQQDRVLGGGWIMGGHP